MAKAQEVAEQHPILLQYYRDGVTRTAHELESVISGRFSFQIWQVPELSVHAMNLVDKRCTLMFPLTNSEALLTPILATPQITTALWSLHRGGCATTNSRVSYEYSFFHVLLT
jgi:hypothetical protein